jgi:lysyl-tRNA synthetase class 1
MLLSVLQNYDEIMEVMLPTLRDERRATYSPFLPICQKTNRVLQVSINKVDVSAGTITYKDPDTDSFVEVPVINGNCKLQWKVDWSGRWSVFDVDYEMSGKDLIPSFALSSKICRILGGTPPENLSYELFLDQYGQKISKSKGNGLTIDEWLRYSPPESLAYYMFQSPKKAKRLYFDVIPKAVDEYIGMLSSFEEQNTLQKMDNPVFHIHDGNPPRIQNVLSFNILLNLAAVCGAENDAVMWGFVQKYIPDASIKNDVFLSKLIHYAVVYYHDFIKPKLQYRDPTDMEKEALLDLYNELQQIDKEASPDKIQNVVFEVGKKYNFENLRQWFQSLYEVLLGNSDGPRMGSFIALYGIDNMCKLIDDKIGRCLHDLF